MIPANGNFRAYFRDQKAWTGRSLPVQAWDDQGRPMVLGDKGLVCATEMPDFQHVREVQTPVDPASIPHVYFDEDEVDDMLPVMQEQTITALRNYDWLIRSFPGALEEISLGWDCDTLELRNGGTPIEEICREGFTPATGAPQPKEQPNR